MMDLWAWLTPQVLVLIGFHLFIALMMALDLGVFHRRAHVPSFREAAAWTAVWVGLALLFAVGIWQFWHRWQPEDPHGGAVRALEFVTGYLTEESLSVDNLFVFLIIFRYFSVPKHLQHRVLVWGILGAVVLRAIMIVAGAALLATFHWMIVVFGAFLIYTGYKLFRSVDEELDPGKNPVLNLVRRVLPLVTYYEGGRFWVKHDGRWHATPLVMVLVVVESTDVVFAVDSIPAIFGITTDPFIVYTSNIFAILGLRSLYFMLAGLLGSLRFLNVGLALVLGFVGVKMIVEAFLEHELESLGLDKGVRVVGSLGVIAAILGTALVVSLLAGPGRKAEPEPEPAAAAADAPPDA